MTTFVRLRIENDAEAATLVDDMAENSGHPLLTPVQENTVYATIEDIAKVADLLAEHERMRVALEAINARGDAEGDFECCASGRCEVCTPGYVWGRDG